jgi:hypothetical protein
MIETAAPGLCRRTQEQTVSLLNTITATATAISSPNAIQLAVTPMLKERAFSDFLRGGCASASFTSLW